MEQEEDLVHGPYFSTGTALALVQRLTGVRLTARDLTDPAGKIALGMHPG